MKKIKGVILAGGSGSRLFPLTKIINKHLLPVYNKPMIYYPLETLVEAGIKQIMIVTGGNKAGDYLELLGNGNEFGLNEIHYSYQKGAGGIADALNLARDFIGNDRFVVILGDNILQYGIKKYVEDFKKQSSGAKILLKEVENPERFGVASIDEGGKVLSIVEKPKVSKSSYAVIGVYMYDSKVFNIIPTLQKSDRGELEITDINNIYIKNKKMTSNIIDGWWTDAGTIESLYKATKLVREGYEDE